MRISTTGKNLSIARCGAIDCLYIADIGDNLRSRKRITIYRVPEPEAGSATTQPADEFYLTYPDGPHDAEALVATQGPTPELYIITKEVPPRVYRVEGPLRPGQSSRLAFVRSLTPRERFTGAAASPDGRWIAARSNDTLSSIGHRTSRAAAIRAIVDLGGLDEPQGEGVAFDRDNDVYLVQRSRKPA